MQVFIDLVNFSFSGMSGLGTDLDYCDVDCFALKTNGVHSGFFLRLQPSTAFQSLLSTLRAIHISSKGFLTIVVVDIMVI